MLFFPEEISSSTSFNLIRAFDLDNSPKETTELVKTLNEQRREFNLFFQKNLSKFDPKIKYETHETLKEYLYKVYDIMEVMCTKGSYSMAPTYYSSFTFGNPIFEVLEDNEICTTFEIIFSRYTYVIGVLQSKSFSYNSLGSFCKPGGFEGLSNAIKDLLSGMEDICIRFSKFFYSRDLIWGSMEKAMYKYSNFPETNYFLVEGFYLLFELMFSNVLLLKVFILHWNSVRYNQMVKGLITHMMNKMKVLKAIFDAHPTKLNKQIKQFCSETTEFCEFGKYMSLYLLNKIEEKHSMERKKTFKQLYHENFLLGSKLIQFHQMKKNKPYFMGIVEYKYSKMFYKDVDYYQRVQDEISATIKSININSLVVAPDLNCQDFVRKLISKNAKTEEILTEF